MTPRRTALLVGALAASLVLAACGDDDSGSGDTTAAGTVTVTGQWARTSPMSAENGAAYMVLTASEDDALVGASTDVAGTVEVHETVMASEATGGMTEDTGMTDDTSMGSGEMVMQPIESLELPAGEAVALEPGGYHIMMIGLTAPLETGSTFELTLDFENAPDQTITVPVQDEAP